MLQPLKHVTKRRSLFSSFLIHINNLSSFSSSSSSSSSSHNCHTVLRKINQNDFASSVKDWFNTRDPIITRIFQILSSTDSSSDAALDASLAALTLPRLDESFVLTVLHHGTAAAHIYPCLRFFDWAGRQPGFHHTRGTFSAIFRILARNRSMSTIIEFLRTFRRRGPAFYPHARFNDTLVIGYAIAGKPEIALQLFVRQIRMKGFENRYTNALVMKSLCKQGRLDEAEGFLFCLVDGGKKLHGSEKGMVDDALDLFKSRSEFMLSPNHMMDNSRSRFFSLFEMLSHNDRHIYDCFIDAAGHAKQAELAWKVFELMQRNGIQPTSSSLSLMLKAYLKSGRTSDALIFFNNVWSRGLATKKLYNCFVIFLCKSKNPEPAYRFFLKMLEDGLNPSIECYEILVQELCSSERYHEAVNLVDMYEKKGRRITSFLGNILLYQSMFSPEVYNACVRLRGVKEEGKTDWSMLSFVVGAFRRHHRVSHVEDLEKLIAKCFPLDIYTYNLLLRKAWKTDKEQACQLFERMCQRGFEPNQWIYSTMVDGFKRHGMRDKAERWFQESKRIFSNRETRMLI
ncbi:hypothetical protein Ahy_A07g031530 isoform A [Arachis hypogaea]|uniref:Pentatricopeptide repeat-containing protein n=1 Tax=Arachis hypogaea TaxID=3818 RepID=A0A445C457_ARAHY|nr:hypothetical protein Ahy_A07g031530 isoform A [Arachis hypogaea]